MTVACSINSCHPELVFTSFEQTCDLQTSIIDGVCLINTGPPDVGQKKQTMRKVFLKEKIIQFMYFLKG